MKLSDLQGAYREFFITGRSEKVEPELVSNWFEGRERVQIYRNNFLQSLGESLSANFPVTKQLLGDDYFAQVARQFILSSPPAQPRLAEYGEPFPDFLSKLPELAKLAFVIEVARLEWLRIASWYAPVVTALNAEDLQKLDPDQLSALRLRLAPHAQMLRHSYPVDEIWQAHQSAEPDLTSIKIAPQPRASLICRPSDSLLVVALDPVQARFFEALRTEMQLGSAFEAAFGQDESAPVGEAIATALNYRLLVAA